MAAAVPGRAAARIAIRSELGWRHRSGSGGDVWVKGTARGAEPDTLLARLAHLGGVPDLQAMEALLAGLEGHFAVVIARPGFAFAAVDWVRSVPIAFARGPEGWIIDDQAERLRRRLGLAGVDPDAALAIAMAGYTVDAATLFEGIEQLGPGELVIFDTDGSARRHRYYHYRPWRADKPTYDPNRAQHDLAEVMLGIVDGMMQRLGDRPLVVPLSAGVDSRLLVSAARRLGYRNLRTFSYGRPGNHEAKAARAIAERLGYEWRFVPTDTARMRRHFASEDWRFYCRFADSLQSVPFVQDLPQLLELKETGYVPAEAALANGNSGDYISGAHIVAPVNEVPSITDETERFERIVETLYAKHFSLWQALRSPGNERRIKTRLKQAIEAYGAHLADPSDDYGLYECSEFLDRQCKFVITGQRIYEFAGHDWFLPLWEKPLLDFFEMIPLAGKARQRLYRETLEVENWGGVWSDIPINRKVVKPDWIRPLRLAAKLALAPLGKAAWRSFERRYLQYWMELGGHSAIRPYGEVARDRRGARHGVSWQALDYLESHGVDFTTLVEARE